MLDESKCLSCAKLLILMMDGTRNLYFDSPNLCLLRLFICLSALACEWGRGGLCELSCARKKLAWCLEGRLGCWLWLNCFAFQRMSAERGNEGCGMMMGLEQDGGTSTVERVDPSTSLSCLALISSAVSQLLFPACPGIHLVPSVVLYFLQKPPERLQMSPAVWMPSVSLRTLLASRRQGRTSSRGFKSSQPKMKRTPTVNTNKHETVTSFDTFQAFAMGVHSLQPLPHILSANAKSPCIRHTNVRNLYRHGLHLSVSTALICLCVHGFR